MNRTQSLFGHAIATLLLTAVAMVSPAHADLSDYAPKIKGQWYWQTLRLPDETRACALRQVLVLYGGTLAEKATQGTCYTALKYRIRMKAE